ncbi:transcriptional regulator with XRE-family HTH domain [Comamonas odontotermitis]|uniref:Transcriptional regulator with XRE-family HTH domain n=1 Tax=Comamonas odontotermitis TaxID=379895 RepID=A0ABR6RH24_9BURK|nr:helix-turn-helix transcriptional regulator [Comamonas odontotermitis]MBB6578452.1 transcriptional regulator with XRE-family HTH domain [Comamonas odontotermitis]
MKTSPLNQALADNLAYHMEKRGLTQMALAKKCGIGQTTISLYLNPERRKQGKDAKPGSAKLTEVEMLANALDVEPWELVRPLDGIQRLVYERIEEAYKALSKQPLTSNPSKQQQPTAEANEKAKKQHA